MNDTSEMKSLFFHQATFTQPIPGTDLTYQAELTLTKDEWLELLETLEKVIPLDDYATIPGGGESEFSYRLFVSSNSRGGLEVYKKRENGRVLVVIAPSSALSTPFDKIHVPVVEAEKLIASMREYFQK